MAVERVRTTVKTDKDGFYVDRPGPFFAICIGPESDVDECIIIPEGKDAPVPEPAGLDGTVNWQHVLHPDAIHVSVERPFIGEIRGPFRVLYPYAHAYEGAAAGVDLRLRPYNDSLWFMAGVSVPPRQSMGIELELHTCMPTWLPTKRAPLKVPFRFPSFGSSGVSDVDLLIPVMGRRAIQFGIDGSVDSGSLTWSVTGLTVIEDTDGNVILSVAETLQADTVESADFEESYRFDGEFDVLWIRIDETTAMPAAQGITGYVKAWD